MISHPANLIMAWKNRKRIDWKLCTALTALVILGNIPGVFLLKIAGANIIKVILGFVIIYLSVEMYLNENRKTKKKSSKLSFGIAGFLTGLVAGIYGVGALLGVYVNKITNDTTEFKANASVIYFVSGFFSSGSIHCNRNRHLGLAKTSRTFGSGYVTQLVFWHETL